MDPTRIGMNRTGVQMSPLQAAALLDLEGLPAEDEALDPALPQLLRRPDLVDAEPVGSVPPPGTLTGVARSGANLLAGHRLNAFLDKLGERLAFERSGVRLYDAMLEKCRERTDETVALDLAVLQRFRAEEAEHFQLLRRAIERLGGDPTAQTPCADVAGVANAGLLQVVRDPRTSIAQCLQAVLTAELVDGAAWELLQAMAEDFEYEDLADDFAQATRQEALHLEQIRAWHEQAVLQTGHRHADRAPR